MTKLPSAKIRDSLEQRIIEGELGIGKRLDEAELSAHYGVSRTPVREALQRLAESGLAEHLPRRGTFVRAPSLAELVEMTFQHWDHTLHDGSRDLRGLLHRFSRRVGVKIDSKLGFQLSNI